MGCGLWTVGCDSIALSLSHGDGSLHFPGTHATLPRRTFQLYSSPRALVPARSLFFFTFLFYFSIRREQSVPFFVPRSSDCKGIHSSAKSKSSRSSSFQCPQYTVHCALLSRPFMSGQKDGLRVLALKVVALAIFGFVLLFLFCSKAFQ